MVILKSPPSTIYNSSPSRPSPREVVQIPNAVRVRCGYSPKAVHRAHQTSPHAVSATVKRLYHVTRNMPENWCVVVARIGSWLRKHAY